MPIATLERTPKPACQRRYVPAFAPQNALAHFMPFPALCHVEGINRLAAAVAAALAAFEADDGVDAVVRRVES